MEDITIVLELKKKKKKKWWRMKVSSKNIRFCSIIILAGKGQDWLLFNMCVWGDMLRWLPKKTNLILAYIYRLE